jgi:hypothetical protein
MAITRWSRFVVSEAQKSISRFDEVEINRPIEYRARG